MTRMLLCGLILLLPLCASAQQAVTNPHGDLDTGCESCHGAEGWIPARTDAFDHSTTGFPLERAHSGLDCGDCHTDLQFSQAGSECVDCHADVHLGELGQDCDRCHTAHSFVDMAQHRQMHREVSFALNGAHAGADCRDCHVPRPLGGLQYLGTSQECFDCHEDDYNGAENHVSSNFPLDCQFCHNPRSWEPDFRDHDNRFFPIFRGAHAGEWDSCSECHTIPTDYRAFDCLNCHPHSDKARTDADHRGEASGYTYDSDACYRCHPDGRGDD